MIAVEEFKGVVVRGSDDVIAVEEFKGVAVEGSDNVIAAEEFKGVVVGGSDDDIAAEEFKGVDVIAAEEFMGDGKSIFFVNLRFPLSNMIVAFAIFVLLLDILIISPLLLVIFIDVS